MLTSCNNETYKFDDQNRVVLLKAKNYEIYTSKRLFSKHLKEWVLKHPDIKDDKYLLMKFEKHINESPLDLDAITSENSVKDYRLKFRASDMLESKDAYTYNIKTHEHVKVRIDTTFTNHFFTVGIDTLFTTLDRIE